MSREEAKKVLEIMTDADGGCYYCARNLMIYFVDEFGFKKLAERVYQKRFDINLYEESDV